MKKLLLVFFTVLLATGLVMMGCNSGGAGYKPGPGPGPGPGPTVEDKVLFSNGNWPAELGTVTTGTIPHSEAGEGEFWSFEFENVLDVTDYKELVVKLTRTGDFDLWHGEGVLVLEDGTVTSHENSDYEDNPTVILFLDGITAIKGFGYRTVGGGPSSNWSNNPDIMWNNGFDLLSVTLIADENATPGPGPGPSDNTIVIGANFQYDGSQVVSGQSWAGGPNPSQPEGYQLVYNPSSLMNGHRITAGDVITLSISFKSDRAADSIDLFFLDNHSSAGYWNELTKRAIIGKQPDNFDSDEAMMIATLPGGIVKDTVYTYQIQYTALKTATAASADRNNLVFFLDADHLASYAGSNVAIVGGAATVVDAVDDNITLTVTTLSVTVGGGNGNENGNGDGESTLPVLFEDGEWTVEVGDVTVAGAVYTFENSIDISDYSAMIFEFDGYSDWIGIMLISSGGSGSKELQQWGAGWDNSTGIYTYVFADADNDYGFDYESFFKINFGDLSGLTLKKVSLVEGNGDDLFDGVIFDGADWAETPSNLEADSGFMVEFASGTIPIDGFDTLVIEFKTEGDFFSWWIQGQVDGVGTGTGYQSNWYNIATKTGKLHKVDISALSSSITKILMKGEGNDGKPEIGNIASIYLE